MSRVMEIFEEYCPCHEDAKLTLAGDLKNWIWLKSYVFTEKKIDMEKELEILNNPLPKHKGNNYKEFSVCLEPYFLPNRAFGSMSREIFFEALKKSYNLMVNFWTTIDENASMTWTITEN